MSLLSSVFSSHFQNSQAFQRWHVIFISYIFSQPSQEQTDSNSWLFNCNQYIFLYSRFIQKKKNDLLNNERKLMKENSLNFFFELKFDPNKQKNKRKRIHYAIFSSQRFRNFFCWKQDFFLQHKIGDNEFWFKFIDDFWRKKNLFCFLNLWKFEMKKNK